MARKLTEAVRTAGLASWSVGAVSSEPLATAGMILLGCWLALELAVGEVPLDLRALARRWWPLWLFVGWALLGPLAAGRPPTGTGVARAVDWLAIPAAALAMASASPAVLRRIAIATAAVFLLSCAVAAFQHYGLWPGPAAFERWSWTRVPFQRVYEPAPGAPGRFMAGGLFAHRLKFAHVGGLAVAFAACLGLRAKGWQRWLALGTAAAGAASIVLLTYARAAVIGLAVALPLALLLSMRWARWSRAAVVFACVAVLASAGMNGALRQRFVSALTTDGSGARTEILASGARAVREHPVAGVGLGRFRPSLYAAPDVPQYVLENPGKAHNQLLSIAAETGLPGAALFLLLAVWLARSLQREHPAGAAGLSSLAFFAVLSLFHDPLYQAPFSMGLALALGAAMGLGRVSAPAPARTPPAS